MRIHVEEGFAGDIEGVGVVEFLQAAQADGAASLVGNERVISTDRRGPVQRAAAATFALR